MNVLLPHQGPESEPDGSVGIERDPVNNWGGLGRWAFLEVTDPWDAGNLIREKFLTRARVGADA